MNLLEKINFEGDLLKLKRTSTDIPGVSELVETFLSSYQEHNPLAIANSFVQSTNKFSYEPTIKKIREGITQTYKDNLFRLELESIKFELKRTNSPFYNRVIEHINTITESAESDQEVKVRIKQDLAEQSHIPQIKNIVQYANAVDNEVNSTANHYTKPVYSPVIENDGKFYFYAGKTYEVFENEARVVKSTDEIFNKLAEATETFNFTDNKITFYNKDHKVELFKESELRLEVDGKEIPIDENLENTLLMSRVFDANSYGKLDKLKTVIANHESIVRLDNVKQIMLRESDLYKVNVITLNENIAVHRISADSKFNEFSIYESSARVIEDVKEFLGYDLTESLQEFLSLDKSKLKRLKEHRALILQNIDFLQDQKGMIDEHELKESETLKEASDLLDTEINKYIKQLDETTQSILNLSEKSDNMEDKGYIEGIMKKDGPSKSKLSKGDQIWIFAEDYTTSGSKDDIMIKTEDGTDVKIKKELVAPTS